MRRVIFVWLPRFFTDRLTRSRLVGLAAPYARWDSFPLATVVTQAAIQRINAVNDIALGLGLETSLALSDARAIVPTLKVLDADPVADQICLDRLLAWSWRYTPWVTSQALDSQGGAGLWLDVTGCTHLFGGERDTLDDLSVRLDQLGFSVRLGISDTPGAAWAVAHYLAGDKAPVIIPEGEKFTHLSGLPVSALRLSSRALDTLTRLGVRTILELLTLPRAPLTRRFGREVCLRLDQLVGRIDEPLSPKMEFLPYVVNMDFAEPIGRIQDVETALHSLLNTLCTRLENDRKGARRISCELFRVDNTAQCLQVGTGRAVRQPNHLLRLFSQKLNGLDVGFGIESIVLSVTSVELLNVEEVLLPNTFKSSIRTPKKPGRDLGILVDRLEGRLGRERVVRPFVRHSHIPERAFGFVTALNADHSPLSPVEDRESIVLHSDRVQLRSCARPIYLLPKPEPIRLLGLQSYRPRMRAVPPIDFEWGGYTYHLATVEGPERITGRWWRGVLPADRSVDGRHYSTLCEDGGAVRDYWRVESEAGLRFWLFHLPMHLVGAYPEGVSRWFIHGLFS